MSTLAAKPFSPSYLTVEEEHAIQKDLFVYTSFHSRNIYIPSESQEKSLQMYTSVFSLEVKMVEILTDLNRKWKWGSDNIRPVRIPCSSSTVYQRAGIGEARLIFIIFILRIPDLSSLKCKTEVIWCIGRSKGKGVLEMAHWRSKFFHFHTIFSKKWAKIIPIWELAPSPSGKSWICHCDVTLCCQLQWRNAIWSVMYKNLPRVGFVRFDRYWQRNNTHWVKSNI